MNIDFDRIPASLCVSCKGVKLLCGKSSCPIISKFFSSSSLRLNTDYIQGSSPPSVFVGSFGYPKVRIGPALPPIMGDTEIYEKPDLWVPLSIDKIAEMRLSLYRGYKVMKINEASNPGSFLSDVHDLILSRKHVDAELLYSSREMKVDLSPETQPFGPGGYIRKFEHSGSSSDPVLEKMYYDIDIPASEAIVLLYDETSLYSIQKMLSAGMLGRIKGRKIVPTRWSITAVDKTISDSLLENIITYQSTDKNEFFYFSNIGNTYFIGIFPGPYSFEMIEDWNNGSIWTGNKGEIVEGDYEDIRRRVLNPKIGGSFFAAKLPTLDYMERKNVQGRIIVARFISGDYTMPLGVWQIRENIRTALSKGNIIDSFDKFFSYIKVTKGIDLRIFSRTYQIVKNQRLLTEYGNHYGT